MQKHLLSIVTTLVLIFGIGVVRRVQANTVMDVSQTPLATSAYTDTPRRTATATVDFAATAKVAGTQAAMAQATSFEAARINAQATTVYRQIEDGKLQATAESERRAQEKLSWTATAMLTAIPLTATAQVVNSTAIANYQVMQSAQMTATHEAPDILRDAKFAEAYNGTVDFWVRAWAFIGIGALGVFVPIVLWMVPRKSLPVAPAAPVVTYPREVVQYEQPETVIRVQSETGNYPSMSRMVVPCTPNQLTELAKGILHEGQTFNYKNWEQSQGENKKPVFTRIQLGQLRSWMQANKLVQSTGANGGVMLTDEGESLLINWLDAQALPTNYKFDEMKE